MSHVQSSLKVALAPHSSGRHLSRYCEPDEPFFLLNDTAWELVHKLDMEEAKFFLDNRAEKGFNCVMITLVAEMEGLELPNKFGQLPFHPVDKSGEGHSLDVYRPNEAYFEFVDRLITYAASLGITLMFVPAWGRYVTGGLQGGPIIFDEDSARAYGTFLGSRYPFHPWILGGDTPRWWNPKALSWAIQGNDLETLELQDYGPVWEAMAEGIKSGEQEAITKLDDPRCKDYSTFMTYHTSQSWFKRAPAVALASAQFPDAAWLSLDCVQSGHSEAGMGWEMWSPTSSYIPIRQMYNTPKKDGTPRPVIDLEPHYDNTPYGFQKNQPFWSGADIRNGGYQALFAGSCGYTYGVHSIWRMWDPAFPIYSPPHPHICDPPAAWHAELDLSGAYYASIMKKIFTALPNYHTRKPQNDFILSERNEPNDGTGAGTKLISGMTGVGWAMIHLPYGGIVEVNIEKALSRSTDFQAWWINPRDGSKHALEPERRHTPHREFESPSCGTMEQDWILYIEQI